MFRKILVITAYKVRMIIPIEGAVGNVIKVHRHSPYGMTSLTIPNHSR
jgi:hypothetical protein